MKSGIYKRLQTLNNFKLSDIFMVCVLATSISIIPVQAQQIIPDGKTQTKLSVNQNVTNITTSTIKGSNAFNSFSRFNVDTGNVVNLNIPGSASRLINIVHGEVSSINGVLNSIKGGHIGGNIFLVNPNGIFVGPQGVINTGSLTAITPSKQFTDNFFTSPGNPDDAAVNALINGTAPINKNAVIGIEGKINTINDLNIQTGSLSHAGGIYTGAAYKENNVQMGDVVNINTVENGSSIAVNSGNVIIKATNDIISTGKIIADGGNNIDAGNISMIANNNIAVKNGSDISASGKGQNSDGGDIYIYASKKADFESGAKIAARGGNLSGDAGNIELSAKEVVNYIGGDFDASANNGKMGNVLIDPYDLLIDPAYFGAPPPYKVNQNYSFTADHNITIQNISTFTYAQGSTGTITITAGNDLTSSNVNIDVGSVISNVGNNTTITNSKIVAHNVFTVKSGTITATNSRLGGDGSNFIQATKGNMSITNNNVASDYLHLGTSAVYSVSGDLSMNNNQKVTFNSIGSLDINVGGKVNLTNTGVSAASLKLVSGGDVTMNNSSLTATSTGTFNLSTNGNLFVNEIFAPNGHLNVQVKGNITDNNAAETPNFSGNSVLLNASGGTIGTLADNINIHNMASPSLIALASGVINIGSPDSIYVYAISNAGKADIYLNSTFGIYSSSAGVTNVYGKSVSLNAANREIGTSSVPLIVDTNYLSTGGFLTASAFSNISIKEAAGDLNINSVKSNSGGNVNLYGSANIVDNALSASSAVTGNSVYINTTGGTVGTAANPLDIEVNKFLTGGNLFLLSGGLININQMSGTLPIYVISNAGKADVTINCPQGSITDANPSEVPNIYGKNITLNAPKGSIGLASSDLNLYTDYSKVNATLNATASGIINLYQHTVNLWVNRLQSTGGDVKLYADGSILDGRATEDANIIGNNITMITVASGSIGLFNDDFNFYLNGNGNMTAQAFGYIYLNALQNNFGVNFISNAGRSDVKLIAANSILDGSAAETPNIYANAVNLTATAGTIGSATNNFNLDSDFLNKGGAVTAVSNGLINIQENTGVLNINTISNAGKGDVQLVSDLSLIDKNSLETANITAKNITLSSLNANIGSATDDINVYMNFNTTGGTGNFAALKGLINLSQTTGDLYINQAQSLSNNTLKANGSMFNSRTDTAANIQGGNINITATTGSLGTAAKHLRAKSSTGVVQTKAAQNTYVDKL